MCFVPQNCVHMTTEPGQGALEVIMVSCLLHRQWPGTAVRAPADYDQFLSTLVLAATGHLWKSRVGTAGDTRKGLSMNPIPFSLLNRAELVLCLAGPLAIWTHSKEDAGYDKRLHCRGASLGAQNLAHSRKSSWAWHCALEPQFWRHKYPLGSLARHPDLIDQHWVQEDPEFKNRVGSN